MSRSIQINLRMSAEEKNHISSKAKEQGIPFSEYVRQKAMETDISNRDLMNVCDRHTVNIIKTIHKKNDAINKVLDLAWELLQSEDNQEYFVTSKDDDGEELPEHHLMDSLINILTTKLSLIKSEDDVIDDDSRKYAIKVVQELVDSFIELKREVI